MDAQTIPAQENSYDISSDGLAVSGYEEEPTQPEPLKPDGIALDANGEVSFGDEFFEGMSDEPPEQQTEQQPQPQAYTPDELKATPFEQWELSRLKGDISQFAPIVQEQLRQRSIQQAAQNAPLPEYLRTEPKAYTFKELSEAGIKLACEKLGITDVDDFDSYENEHQAAYQMALYDLRQRRDAEILRYRTEKATWPELMRFNAELQSRPDYNEFDMWVSNELAKMKTTPEQMNKQIYSYVAQSGGDYTVAARMIAGWYQQFQRERGANPRQGMRPAQMMRPVPQQPRRITPPATLEGTNGNMYAGQLPISAKAFGLMDEEQQTDALIKLGLV